MKKTILAMMIALAPYVTSAQTTYFTDNVNIKRPTEFSMNILSIGQLANPSNFNSYRISTHSKAVNVSGLYNVGAWGDAGNSSATGSGRAVGVLGIAGNSTSGYNYGVMGRVSGSQNGAGVYGSDVDNMGGYINGRYAGYFNGPTYINGTLTAVNVVTPSDLRLKENIVSLCDVDNGSTLDNVLNMNVIAYNYRQPEIPEAEKDTASISLVDTGYDISAERHYGLCAQEIQEIYPDIVKVGQDGYLGVNYVELVPLLIRSIQELNQKIEAFEGKAYVAATTDIAEMNTAGKAILYQNSPNPASVQTTIRFSLPDNCHDAYIYICDMAGVMKKQIAVNASQQQVVVEANDLTPGIYLYSLVAGGQEIATKRMIISQ